MYKEIRTVILEREVILIILNKLPELMNKYWGDVIKIEHGGMTNADFDKYHVPWDIQSLQVYSEILNQEIVENFRLGNDDIFIYDFGKDQCIHICHESDIHFSVNENMRSEILEILANMKIDLETRT